MTNTASLANGYVESVNNRVRAEDLNMNSFDHIYEARASTAECKEDYNLVPWGLNPGVVDAQRPSLDIHTCIRDSKTLKSPENVRRGSVGADSELNVQSNLRVPESTSRADCKVELNPFSSFGVAQSTPSQKH
jgi:hypothetical protein